MDIYEPQEDSYFLQKWVRELSVDRVLDVGTGSGIQALTAAESKNVKKILAIDINEEAIEKLNSEVKEKHLQKVIAKVSDLFQNVDGQFDTLIFNPPYLPKDKGIEDQALYGGKKGWEISERFFNQASKYLVAKGKILFLFSSYTNKEKIEEILQSNLLSFKVLESKRFPFFEELFIYLIEKSELLRELERKGIAEAHYLAKGKRGIVYAGNWRKRRVIIKVENKESAAIGRINNEIKWLERLNKENIGPKLYFSGKNYFVCAYIEGKRLLEWLKEKNSREIKTIIAIIISILNQCRVMDKLGVSKMEMHHPHKHIIISNIGSVPVQIDFERCREMAKPVNVTQFVEFLCRIKNELENKGLKFDVNELRTLARNYKNDFGKEKLENIINYLAK